MTAPVFLYNAETLMGAPTIGAQLTLTGPEARHAVTVRRLRSGERIDLCDGVGTRLRCEVIGTESKDALSIRVLEYLEEQPEPLRLTLVQALAKGGRDEQAVETATEVGVEAIIPWQAERSIAVWKGPKAAKGRERWAATAREAAKQARRARVPEVAEPLQTASLASWVGEVTSAGGRVLLLHEEASTPLASVPLPAENAENPPVVAVIVGPEGGIGEAETQRLVEAGAHLVRLGPHVMRTASAGPVALAILANAAGLWC